MSVERMNGECWLSCDECGEEQALSYDDFEQLRDDAKKDDWTTVKVEGVWKHYCKCCKHVAPTVPARRHGWSHEALKKAFPTA